jgi:hypothetical protein
MNVCKEELKQELGFRSLDASNLSFLQSVRKETGGAGDIKCLPLIDEEENMIIHATFQKHIKFAVKSSVAPKDEKKTYQLLVLCLVEFYDIPVEFFKNGGKIPKDGFIFFPNTEHQASIRLWCSKKVGKNVIYELTVSSYKDGVLEQLEVKPDAWKKVICY